MDKETEERIIVSEIAIKINELNILCLIEDDRIENNYSMPYIEAMKTKILETQKTIEKYCKLLGLNVNIPTKDTGLCFEPDSDLVDGMLSDVWNMYGDEYLDWGSGISKQDRIDSLQELVWSVAKMHYLKLYDGDILISV